MLAFALGLLIGIERGWAQRGEARGERVAGVRTFALLGLTGGLAGTVGTLVSPWLTTVFIALAGTMLLTGYSAALRRGEHLSATTTIVGLVTLGIGLLATNGQGVAAAVIAAATVLILSSRNLLHGWVGRLSEGEVQAMARFALIAIAIWPVLPDAPYGPYGLWNPQHIWSVVVLVSGFSLAGYAATRMVGPTKGLLATAAAGAVVSSTAVTAAMARRLRGGEEPLGIAQSAIILATAVMLARVLVLVAIIAPVALWSLAWLLGPGLALCLAWATILAHRAHDGNAMGPAEVNVRNPFDIVPALILAALVMVLTVVAHWVLERFGDAGLATVLALSGMVDVDSAIITMGSLPPGRIDPAVAGLILAGPVLLNNLVKAGMTVGIGGWRDGWKAALPLVLTVACAAGSWLVLG
ncbi:MgtC/SapB family protein [Sphingomonas lacunae]|uniref:MgtC/SapB family protein n=1 Tax=Sphingomonas lacunae TaxID=2698828 RepID=UPI001FE6C40A|nr:DUF4010 domain-containing protein [Sphingomonas lacunae]